MTRKTLKAMLWKEWRESRWKWLAFFLALNIPMISELLNFIFHNSRYSSTPSLINWTLDPYGSIILTVQYSFILTVGLFIIPFFSYSTVAPEIENRQIYFLLERPVHRWHVLSFKFLVGAFQTMTSIVLSFLSSICVIWFLAQYKKRGVGFEGLWDALFVFVKNAMVGAAITSMAALVVFAITFFLSILFQKWWVGLIAGTLFFSSMIYISPVRFFFWFVNSGTIENPRAGITLPQFSPLKPLPLLVMLASTAVFYLAAQFLFKRKEMK